MNKQQFMFIWLKCRYWKDYPPRTGTVAIKDIIHYVDKNVDKNVVKIV